MYQFVDGKDKHVFGRFTTGTLVNPKEHASFIIMDGGERSLSSRQMVDDCLRLYVDVVCRNRADIRDF